MRIPAYQIHNVLQQYTDQLTDGGRDQDNSGLVRSKPEEDAGFLATIKRVELIGMITERINEYIGRIEMPGAAGRETAPALPGGRQSGPQPKNGESTPFVYNAIDEDQRKVKRAIAVTKFYEP